MSRTVLYACHFCRKVPSFDKDDTIIDGKTVMGPWAYMCDPCHEEHGVGIGTGLGQRFKLSDNSDTPKLILVEG